MATDALLNIAKIIERDNKTSTYKFALLRATIDIIQDNSPFMQVTGNRVYFPMGLLINKWIFYYYPLLAYSQAIPQINSPKGIAFNSELCKLIDHYEQHGGGISVLYNDIRIGKMQGTALNQILELYAKMKKTIAGMPMKHLGYSINKKHYSIFQYHSGIFRKTPEIAGNFINGYGTFSIPIDYYEAFKLLGSFISGQDSLIAKWADFSFSSQMNRIGDKSEIINQLLEGPITERDVKESKAYYQKVLEDSGNITCVWTGNPITSFDIDHVIPFSVWKNNDLWNLLPSTKMKNNKKRDKIPSPYVLEHASKRIFKYWSLLFMNNEIRFRREIENSLLGQSVADGWQLKALNRLQENADYLIKKRGYEEWKN